MQVGAHQSNKDKDDLHDFDSAQIDSICGIKTLNETRTKVTVILLLGIFYQTGKKKQDMRMPFVKYDVCLMTRH